MTAWARPRFWPLLTLIALGSARAAWAAGDTIDDPKLARRLGARVGEAAAVNPPLATAAAPVPEPAVPGAPPATASTSGSIAPAIGVSAAASAVPSPGPSDGIGGRTPLLGLAYRRFSFVQVGATASGSTNGLAASEPFDSVALDFYPISRTLRFGLSTQYGWQSGRFNSRGGDYFIAQSASLGVQLPGQTVTPFAEGFAGGGYLRRFQFDRTIPTAYWQFGIDAGASIFVADHGYFSVALGYLRPVNGFLKQQSFTSVYVDTWSIKFGFGI
jgi:hypothetical protein